MFRREVLIKGGSGERSFLLSYGDVVILQHKRNNFTMDLEYMTLHQQEKVFRKLSGIISFFLENKKI